MKKHFETPDINIAALAREDMIMASAQQLVKANSNFKPIADESERDSVIWTGQSEGWI